MRRKACDWDFCSECRYQSSKDYSASDKEYDHGNLTNIMLDGTTLCVDSDQLDE